MNRAKRCSKKMLSTPISYAHHRYWRELPTLQNWPIVCQGVAMRAEWPIAASSPKALIWGCPLVAASRRAGACVHSQLSAAAREQSPGHSPRPCRLDTFLQLLREAKSQESTCCFTYSCQQGKNKLNPGCCRLPIPCRCQLLSCALMQH